MTAPSVTAGSGLATDGPDLALSDLFDWGSGAGGAPVTAFAVRDVEVGGAVLLRDGIRQADGAGFDAVPLDEIDRWRVLPDLTGDTSLITFSAIAADGGYSETAAVEVRLPNDAAPKRTTLAPVVYPEAGDESIWLLQLRTGQVVVELFDELAPNHSERIRTLTRNGEYDGVAFHRVFPGFVAQAGDVEFGDLATGYDPSRVGTGSSSLPDIGLEANNANFIRGIVGMARSALPNTANSQFFIVKEESLFLNAADESGNLRLDANGLPVGYTAFGLVLSGIQHVDALKTGTNADNGAVQGTPDWILGADILADVDFPFQGFRAPGRVLALNGVDDEGVDWTGSTITYVSEFVEGDISYLEGYFDWVASDGRSGREFFTGNADGPTNTYDLQGTRLAEGATGLTLGRYRAVAPDIGAIPNFSWISGRSGDWTAPELEGAFAGDGALEYFARQTAYREGALWEAFDGGPAAGDGVWGDYTISRTFGSADGTGDTFFAVALEAEGKTPVIAIRGTATPQDVLANTDPLGVGATQFAAAWPEIEAWLADRPGASVTGHSLGGAQAQLLAVAAAAAGIKLGKVHTFNAPGIEPPMDGFDTDGLADVRHYIASGDLVSQAGTAFLPGEVVFYDFDSFDPANPFAQLFNAHTDHWAQPALYTEPGSAGVFGEAPTGFAIVPGLTGTEALSASDFSLLTAGDGLDSAYFALLYAIARAGMLPGLAVLPGIGDTMAELAAGLTTRAGTEALRRNAASIEPVIDLLLTAGSESGALDPVNADAIAQLGNSADATIQLARLWTARDAAALDRYQDADAWKEFAQLAPQTLLLGIRIAVETVFGSTADETLTGGAGETVMPGLGVDTVVIGAAGSIVGTLAELAGDTVEGFASGNRLVLPEVIAPAAITLEAGSAILGVDNDADGSPDATITLSGDYDATLFEIGGSEDETEIAIAEPGAVALPAGTARFLTRSADGVRIAGTGASEVIVGGSGDDIIVSGGGQDTMLGGDGADLLIAGGEGDRMTGGAGADIFAFHEIGTSSVTDRVTDFERGVDRLRVSADDGADASAPPQTATEGDDLVVTLAGGRRIVLEGLAGEGGLGEGDIITASSPARLGFASLSTATTLSDSADRLLLQGPAAGPVEAGGGNDVLAGSASADTLSGGEGHDLVRGGAGDDHLEGGPGNDIVRGGGGRDVFFFRASDGPGIDIVEDFDTVDDTLNFIGYTGLLDPGDLDLTGVGTGNVVLTLPDGHLVLFRGVDAVEDIAGAALVFTEV
jgi:cyclophilin family peptidyl-prolyl cis-trans isomerase/Ca2+-binding RTX toxin-like protein